MKEYTDNNEIVQLAAFRVGNEEYVVDIKRVREIIRAQTLTAIRRGPVYVEGVLNLRGAVIPVIDMRRRFDLPEVTMPGRKIIILMVQGRTLGLIVDAVTEVVRVPFGSMQPAPGLLGPDRAPFFSGVCHYKNRTLILLNIKNVVATDAAIKPPDAPYVGSSL